VKDNKENNKQYKRIGILVCLVIFIASLTHFYFLNDHPIVDDQTYDIIRKANNGYDVDPLVEKELTFRSDMILMHVLEFTDYNKALLILITGIVLLMFIALYFTIDQNYLFFFILPITPFFLKITTTYSDMLLIACLLAIFGYFFKKGQHIGSFIAYLGISFLSFYMTLFLLIMMGFGFIKKKIKFRYVLLFALPLLFNIDLARTRGSPIKQNILEKLFTDFGALYGIPIVIAALAIIGLIIVWKKEPNIKFIAITSILIAIPDLKSGLLLLNILSIYLASKLINKLYKEKWQSKNLKQISVLLIFCSILFSGMSYYSETIYQFDDPVEIDAMKWIKIKTIEDGKVFSHHSYGHKIKFFSEREVLLDNDLEIIERAMEKYEDTQIILHSRNYETTSDLLKKHNIEYIFITQEMKEGLVWNKDNEGLIFIMKNNKEFSRIFNNTETEIWWFSSGENKKNTI